MPAFRGHDSARKFHCDVPGCSASFVKRAHLRRHEMTHTRRRDFHCPGCNRAFSRNDSMARHLRRKHPHLYHSHETASAGTTGVERVFTGCTNSTTGASTTGDTFPSPTEYSTLSLRSPFDHSNSSNTQHYRAGDAATLHHSLGRLAASPDASYRGATHHSQVSVDWRGPSTSRLPEPQAQHSAAYLPQNDGLPAYQGRFDYAVKVESDDQDRIGSQAFFSNPAPAFDDTDRSFPPRRHFNEHETSYRTDWMQQYAQPHHQGGFGARINLPAVSTSPYQWERQADGMSYPHPSASGGWMASQPSPMGPTVQFAEHGQREPARWMQPGAGYPQAALPSGASPSIPSMQSGIDENTGADLLQSEFFVGAMRPKCEDAGWTNLDPCVFIAQPSERVRVESAPESSSQQFLKSFAPPAPGLSPSGGSTEAADSYFAVDFRALCDQVAPSEPPDAGQMEQILADLGIDFAANQSATVDASQTFSSHEAFAKPLPSSAGAAPSVPSQGAMPAPWTSDRLAPSSTSMHIHPMSQAQSSQNSFYLPSLTASQTEYLGPSATSHRRTMDRVFSSASMSFESGSQTRDHHHETQSLQGDVGGNHGKSISFSIADAGSQEVTTGDADAETNANFYKPHDSSPPHRAARDEEGGWKVARIAESPHQSAQASALPRPASAQGTKQKDASKKDGCEEAMLVDSAASIVMGPPQVAIDQSGASNEKAEMDIDVPPLPEDSRQRNSSASIASSAVSGDQLQLVVERFRAFAQLCQDHMHPSAAMLESLAPLIPKVIHSDVPVFHPRMIGSQKAHSPEEVYALFSLASLRSNEPHLREEGDRLICFLYGLVMLSYKHTLHSGGALHSFLNCLLLVGVHGMRQSNPDLWLRFEENRESILLDVLKAETRNAELDQSLDRIDTAGLQELPEEELFELWSRWYDHESRKRSRIYGAIVDSQSSSYFSPLKVRLSSRSDGPRCQFLFAHVYEPCPDAVFLAWPPKVWATRLAGSASLPSSKGADMAFRDGQPISIATCLTEQLLKPHVAHLYEPKTYPRFRSSFDFGSQNRAATTFKPFRPLSDQQNQDRIARPTPFVEGADSSTASEFSSRPQSQAEDSESNAAEPETRTVSQLHMLALLESVHGAWMTDSGWYQTPAWGAAALPEQLAIDDNEFDVETASLADLPGWRIGRTLHATQVAHALMNWSEMFSGGNDVCRRSGAAASKLGLKITDDAYQATIRWQATFLSLCVPLHSLCFYLDARKRAVATDKDRRQRISFLLRKWVDSPYCRRALVHAGTILTLLCAAKKGSATERLGPASAHAVFMSLLILVGTSKLLNEEGVPPRQVAENSASRCEELVPIRQVWTSLLGVGQGSGSEPNGGKDTTLNDRVKDGVKQDDGLDTEEDWMRVRFWHRKFQYLGLAGIYREREASCEVYSDWRGSISAGNGGAEGLPSIGGLRAAHLRPRWSSLIGEVRWPGPRRETIHAQRNSVEDSRQSSQGQLAGLQPNGTRNLPRLQLRPATNSTNALQETRRWILQGATHNATFCGTLLWRAEAVNSYDKAASKVLSREQLRSLVIWVRGDNPAWCYSQEYTSLLLGALQEPHADHSSTSANGESQAAQKSS
ncbi:hypothetical protein NDA11_004899 [Ustilago hordei]|nr:hypothetical protein NDA11_004899 [Ustilago hordei]